MEQTIKEWRELTVRIRRAKMKARNAALNDLKKLEIKFDFLRPCPSDFSVEGNGWEKSRTSFGMFTRSIVAMYVRKTSEETSERVIKLTTGHFYMLRTKKTIS